MVKFGDNRMPERWWSKLKVNDENGCWEWQSGSKLPSGYGTFWWNGSKKGIHRVSHSVFNGPIPEGLDVDHICLNRGCANPAHLRAVTHRENMLYGNSLPARQARQTHCKRGHEFTPDNTKRQGNKRTCRTCLNAYKREWKRAHKPT